MRVRSCAPSCVSRLPWLAWLRVPLSLPDSNLLQVVEQGSILQGLSTRITAFLCTARTKPRRPFTHHRLITTEQKGKPEVRMVSLHTGKRMFIDINVI